MNEKDLVELWNDKRPQIISAQMPSVIALAVITVMAMMGYFDGAYPYADSFAALFLVTVGSLSVLNQFAVIREAQSVVKDLKDIKDLSRVAQNITASGSYLICTQVLMVMALRRGRVLISPKPPALIGLATGWGVSDCTMLGQGTEPLEQTDRFFRTLPTGMLLDNAKVAPCLNDSGESRVCPCIRRKN